nr:MAG TPA: hypothetical protein [Caudoviricetes sp.]
MAKKEITHVRCNDCIHSKPFSELVITCKEKNANLVGNAIRICLLFKKK